MFLRRQATVGILCALALALFGCGGSSLTKPFGTNPNDTNHERAFNALIGAPGGTIDIAQRGANLNTQPLALGGAGAYRVVTSGVSIQTFAYQSGTQTQVTQPASVSMSKDGFYTQAAVGIVGTTGVTVPKMVQFTDLFPSVQGTGNVGIRLINLSPGSPAISLYNTTGNPPSAVPISGLTNIDYTVASNYIVAAAGTYNLTLRDTAGNVLFTIPAQPLQAGHGYTVFVIGQLGGALALSAAVITDF